MKQIKLVVLSIALLFGTHFSGLTQVDDLITKYRNNDNFMVMSFSGGENSFFGNQLKADGDAGEWLKKVDSFTILIPEGEVKQIDNSFQNDFTNLFKSKVYNSLIKVKSDGDLVDIRLKESAKNKLGELIVFVDGNDSAVALILKGKFTKEDGKEIATKLNNKNVLDSF